MNVSYPANLGLATSGLGLQACDPAALEAQGPTACPDNAKMGVGSALVEVQFGPELVQETVTLGIYAAPSNDGYLHLAIVAEGVEPVLARIVLTGVVLQGHLEIDVPPLASLPGTPDASLVTMQASLGGALTYYEQVDGRKHAYRPKGIGLPDSCPRGGWKLGASFTFLDGRRSQAGAAISCPRRRHTSKPGDSGRGAALR